MGKLRRILVGCLERTPGLRALLRHWRARRIQAEFRDSSDYWEKRYRKGGTSGAGSFGRLALFKAEVLNQFVAKHRISSVVEFGCGDGRQLALAEYPRYTGVDVSPTVIEQCRARFGGDPTKTFCVYDPLTQPPDPRHAAELALSLDVIYHLVEDPVFEASMRRLFAAARRYVILYSPDRDERVAPHVRLRAFTPWVAANCPDWRLMERIPNRYPYDPAAPSETSEADFYVYERVAEQRQGERS